jgi:hypothetical protein
MPPPHRNLRELEIGRWLMREITKPGYVRSITVRPSSVIEK